MGQTRGVDQGQFGKMIRYSTALFMAVTLGLLLLLPFNYAYEAARNGIVPVYTWVRHGDWTITDQYVESYFEGYKLREHCAVEKLSPFMRRDDGWNGDVGFMIISGSGPKRKPTGWNQLGLWRFTVLDKRPAGPITSVRLDITYDCSGNLRTEVYGPYDVD